MYLNVSHLFSLKAFESFLFRLSIIGRFFLTQIRVSFNQPSKCKSSITGCVFTNLGQWQYFCMIHKTFIQRWLFLNICVLSFFVCTLRWRIYIILECSGKLFSNIKFMCSAFQHLITKEKFFFFNFHSTPPTGWVESTSWNSVCLSVCPYVITSLFPI